MLGGVEGDRGNARWTVCVKKRQLTSNDDWCSDMPRIVDHIRDGIKCGRITGR